MSQEITSKLRRHKIMEEAVRSLMGAGTPPRFKFGDTYASVEFPAGYTVPAQATLEAKFDELLALEETLFPKTKINGDFEIGTGNVFVDIATSNVGIGTTNPQYPLDVNGAIYASGDVIMFSDERKKTNIKPIPNALEKVLKLQGVTFDKLDDGNRRHTGIIAQEVEKVLPEVVYTAVDGTKSVAYGNMIGLLIEAIKELANK